jgi:hypothetical protein
MTGMALRGHQQRTEPRTEIHLIGMWKKANLDLYEILDQPSTSNATKARTKQPP